jgi:hypothetical protein
MQQPAPSIEGTRRYLCSVHLVLLASMILYVWTAEKFISHQGKSLDRTLATAIAIASVAIVGIAFLVRTKMVRPALDALQLRPDDASSLARWSSGSIYSYILIESVVLFGFVLRFLGGTLAQSAPFYAVGIGLMLLWRPQKA